MAWWEWPAFDPGDFYDRDYFQSTQASKGYNDYAALEEGVRRTARARLRRIERVLCGGASPDVGGSPRLLELGCGTGCFLDEARQAGWRVSGVEVSAYAAGVAAARGLHVECRAVEDLTLDDGPFDCVALWDVIEHLREPARVLTTAAAALRSGGVLALSTGDITSLCARLSGPQWHLFNLPEHLFFFSPASLRRLLSRAGCAVMRVEREVNWVPLSYALERVLKSLRGRGATATIQVLDRLPLPATLLDVLGVYAIRRSDV